MRAALLALLVAAEVTAAPRVANRLGPYPRLDRRNRLDTGAADVSLFRFLSASTSIPGGECSGQTVTGTRGESVTFSRTSSANCQKSDGAWVSVAAGKPRVSSLMGQPGILIEQAATNLILSNRDLSNAAWTATAATCTKDATGIDGTSNAASTCSASSTTGTVTQSLTASGNRVTSIYVKRVAGSGAVQITRNGGTTWTTLSNANCVNATTYVAQNLSSSSWSRCYVSSTVTNPVVGIRLNANGDSVTLDGVQDEALGDGATDGPTSPIFTSGTSVARSSDALSISNPAGLTNAAGCWAAKLFKTSSVYAGFNPRIVDTANSYWSILGSATTLSDFTNAATYNFTPTWGVLIDVIGSWSTAANQLSVKVNSNAAATTAYDNTILGSSIHFGIGSGGTQSLNGWMGNIRVGAAAGNCAQ